MCFNHAQSDFLLFWPSYFYAMCSYGIFAAIISPALYLSFVLNLRVTKMSLFLTIFDCSWVFWSNIVNFVINTGWYKTLPALRLSGGEKLGARCLKAMSLFLLRKPVCIKSFQNTHVTSRFMSWRQWQVVKLLLGLIAPQNLKTPSIFPSEFLLLWHKKEKIKDGFVSDITLKSGVM